jgi:predicted unusual protein kinase regulating ubiquinone biosynthesis (AarF/ABC1/UbiB family)
LAQFSVPPLSAPLVIKAFKKSFGKFPNEIFDVFNLEATNAASIGQVHKASKNGIDLAVKIQYPGVADSILSDLAMVKPIAMKMFNIKGENSDTYFKEVENKLLEETNYLLELEQSQEVVSACEHIPNLLFPKYYKELSSQQIITMDWMDGIHLSEFAKINTNQDIANTLGQALWDFYLYQMHVLKKVHADPHPGNFLISEGGQLIAIDFGCMKIIPEEFYTPYFELFDINILNDSNFFSDKLFELEILQEDDTKEEITFFTRMFHDVLNFFTQPFLETTFDFSDPNFFEEISVIGEKYYKSTTSNKMNADRGSRHFIYMNRTFFGLFSLLFDLKAQDIKIENYKTL